jgi:tripartite ATP-independent transporter DctM subunit
MKQIRLHPILRSITFVENGVVFLAFAVAVVLPAIEIVMRIFFKSGIHASSEYVRHSVIWITFAGAMITSRQGRHLSMEAGIALLGHPLRDWIESITAHFSVAIAAVLTVKSYQLIQIGFDPSLRIGIVPVQGILAIMPTGLGVITVRFVAAAPKKLYFKVIAAAGLGTAALFGILPEEALALLLWPGICVLVIGAFAGLPIFIVLGGIAALLFSSSGGSLAVILNESYTMLTGPMIPTLPLFALAGYLLSESKAGERLVAFFKATIGWLPGGLAIMATLVCAFFTTFTGASGVTILALGGLLSIILTSNNYKKPFSIGLLTASGSIGLLFPPSLPIILYGVVSHINIKHLFIAGIVPGLLMVGAVAALGIRHGLKYTRHDQMRFDGKEIGKRFLGALWEILLPGIILLLFFSGITTLVECAAIAVVYTLIIETFVHKDISLKNIAGVVLKCVPMIGGVLIILGTAKGLSYYIIDAEIPLVLSEWVENHIQSKYLFLLLLNIGLLLTGCFMDIFSAIIVVVPLILPLGEMFGIHPVHLGIIFLANLELGYLTPPVGMNLFLASYRFETSLTKLYKTVLPFLLMLLVTVLLITYLPFVTTGLLEIVVN